MRQNQIRGTLYQGAQPLCLFCESGGLWNTVLRPPKAVPAPGPWYSLFLALMLALHVCLPTYPGHLDFTEP